MKEVFEKKRVMHMEEFGFGPEAMKQIKVCKSCGTPCNFTVAFCTDCGKMLPAETLYDLYIRNHFVCGGCKAIISSEYRYCPQCGKQVIFD